MMETIAPTATSTKGKGSPDSLPSIATTSVTSSEAESDAHMSPRVLFQNSDNDDMTKEVVANIQTVIENKNSMIEKKSSGAAAISISSSASTEVAAWNLTNDPTKKPAKSSATRSISKVGVSTVHSSDDDDDEEGVDDSGGAFPTSEMRKLSKKGPIPNAASKASNLISIPSILPSKKPSIIIEDPPKDTVTCNSAAMSMTPKQLTEIFNSFDGNKTIWSMREQYSSQEPTAKEEDSASPALNAAETVRSTAARWMDGWMPQNESLEREHEVLKEVLEDNSNKMLNLREAVETQRALNALKEVEIEDKEKELQEMRTEMDDLARSKELFVQREQELLEIIEELTDKLDDLIEKTSKAENHSEPVQKVVAARAELEPFDEPKAKASFDAEPEPFDEAEDRATVIRRQESLIAGLRNTLKSKDKENYLLKERVDETLAKSAILELYKKDSAAALKAKDSEILSLKARLEVALVENAEKAVDAGESHDDVDSTETVEDIVNDSPSFETPQEVASDDESNNREDQEEATSEESSDTEDLQSDIDQENVPPSPSSSVPPPPAPTGLVAEMRKKLETKGDEEPEKPVAPRELQVDHVSELRMPLEQKGLSRGRSPTPVSEYSTDDEQVTSPCPVPPTPQASPVPSEGLRSAIASLSKRIDDVESVSLGSSCSGLSRKASCDISTIVVKTRNNDDPRRIDFEEEDCPETIEVMLEGQHYGNLDARRRDVNGKLACDDDDKDSCCCWSAAVTADLE